MEPPLPGEAGPRALDYQRPGAERPTRTRVTVAPLADGFRYTDPAATWRDLRPMLLHTAFPIPFMIFVFGIFIHGMKLHGGARTLAIRVVVVLAMWILYDTWREVRRRRSAPTIIDVAGGRLKLRHPVNGDHDWAAREITTLQAVRARSLVPIVESHRGHVRIRAWGRNYLVLKGRPYAEASWFAGELRRGLAILPFSSLDFTALGNFVDPPATPEDVSDESAPMLDGDAAVAPPPEPLATRPVSIGRGEVRRRHLHAIARRYSEAYDRLGCFGGLVLFGGGTIGFAVLVIPAIQAIVISIQFGSHAYFTDHVRFVPHGREWQLTNGQMLNDYLRILMLALVFIVGPLWMFVCANVVLGPKVLAERFRGRL